MSVKSGLWLAVIALCLVFMAHGQVNMMSPLEIELRANLSKVVQEIVHPNATVSEDLVNFALASGGEPKTEQEREAYLGILLEIAANTPDLQKQYTKVTTLADGTKIETVDHAKLTSKVTISAMSYSRKREKEKQKQKQLAAAATAVAAATANTANTGAGNMNDGFGLATPGFFDMFGNNFNNQPNLNNQNFNNQNNGWFF